MPTTSIRNADDLLDLLTTAATIGRNECQTDGTRGEIAARLTGHPAVREAMAAADAAMAERVAKAAAVADAVTLDGRWLDQTYRRCVAKAKEAAGNSLAFRDLCTPLMRRALVDSQIVAVATWQDDEIPAARVAAIVKDLADLAAADQSLR